MLCVRKITLIFATLCLALTAFCAFFFLNKDHTRYQNLVKRAQGNVSHEMAHTVSIQRESVTKEIWLRGKEKEHMRIFAKDSELFLINAGKFLEVVEELDEVNCIIHHPLEQKVTLIKARSGTFDYQKNILTAYDVHLTQIEFQGHEIPENLGSHAPKMQGTATSCEIAMKGEKMNIAAQNFQGSFER